jgi:carbamoyl-phosphate synthase/aspartate carbamoyltransferase/dihydroorotase
MLTAVHEGWLTIESLIELMASNPRRIFNLPSQPDTRVEVDPEATFTIADEILHTKCGWTPFAGLTAHGQVQRVILRGETVYEDGQVLAPPGNGRLLPYIEQSNKITSILSDQ